MNIFSRILSTPKRMMWRKKMVDKNTPKYMKLQSLRWFFSSMQTDPEARMLWRRINKWARWVDRASRGKNPYVKKYSWEY